MRHPRIGINANLKVDEKGRPRHEVKQTYIQVVLDAGGLPVILPAVTQLREAMLEGLDGILLTGGDDIDVRPFGGDLHAKAELMPAQKQEADFALLRALDARPELPVLGICLGMQQMGVHCGARLIQHLHDRIPDGDRHRFDNRHAVASELGSGSVASWHHQALEDGGSLTVIGHADDGLIEAVRHPERPFYVGVQWHPERTPDPIMGLGVVRAFVEAARAAVAHA